MLGISTVMNTINYLIKRIDIIWENSLRKILQENKKTVNLKRNNQESILQSVYLEKKKNYKTKIQIVITRRKINYVYK